MKRKRVTDDPTVKAAVEALKVAVLDVNGDDEVVSLFNLMAVKRGNGLHLVSDTQGCLCPACLMRIRDQFFEVMEHLIEKAAASGAKVH